jgi:hypothetical protein
MSVLRVLGHRVSVIDGGVSKRNKQYEAATAAAKAIDQSFRLRFHSGLGQSGNAFGVRFIRRAEALRFRAE